MRRWHSLVCVLTTPPRALTRHGALGGLACLWMLVILLVATAAWGATVEQFVVFGSTEVTLNQASHVLSGAVGSNGTATFERDIRIDGAVFANRVLTGRGDTFTDNVHYNTLSVSTNVTFQGNRVTPLSLPVLSTLPAVPIFSPGRTNVITDHHANVTVVPGDYDTISIGRNSTVIFTGGLYNTRRLLIERNTRVTFLAATTINVADRLRLEQDGQYAGTAGVMASDIVFNVAGSDPVHIGRATVLQANILAPQGKIVLEQNVALTGAVLGRQVVIERNTVLRLQSAFPLPPGGTVPVPNVVGMPQATAAAAITDVGLTVGMVTTAHSPSVPAGQVMTQSPGAGTRVALGKRRGPGGIAGAGAGTRA